MFTVLAALSGMEREYIRDRTLEGHESARKRGKTIGDASIAMRNSSRAPAGTGVTRPENHDRMPLPEPASAQQAGGSNRTRRAGKTVGGLRGGFQLLGVGRAGP